MEEKEEEEEEEEERTSLDVHQINMALIGCVKKLQEKVEALEATMIRITR